MWAMNNENFKPAGKLRYGWTTGACATAASKAAVQALLGGSFENLVTIHLPGGENSVFSLSSQSRTDGVAVAGVIKDAGDDPDVTHGAEIIVTARPGKVGAGITFRAGEGVGTVTLPGLPVGVGEPAINPAPRKMISQAIQSVAKAHGRAANFEITISIAGGERLAEKTMNGRLGIKGGLSVLGTTGIVKPYSCSAWIHTIQSGVDVARAGGLTHIAAATGKTSEKAVQELYGLREMALIDMGDFAGGLLKYLRRHPLENLTLAGGFAKLTKMAQGHMDLHSSRSELDFNDLVESLRELGASDDALHAAVRAKTAMAVLDIARDEGLALANRIAERARLRAVSVLNSGINVDVCVFDSGGLLVGRAGESPIE